MRVERCYAAIFALCGALGCSDLPGASERGDGIDLDGGGSASDDDADDGVEEGTPEDDGEASGTSSAGDDESGGDDGPPSEFPELLPAGIRRLTMAEYRASVRALFGIPLPDDVQLPPDALQDAFRRNHAQRLDPVLAKLLDSNARRIAAEVTAQVDSLAPCTGGAPQEDCARTFVITYGAKAYRRPLTDDEVAGFLELYRIGAEDGSYGEGIGLVARALLQSSGFLYLTELGDGAQGQDRIALSPYEIAAAISYLAVAEPPDDALVAAASDGSLVDPSVRLAHFDRLVTRDGNANATLLRTLREWLGIDGIAAIAKDSNVYPQFAALREAMDRESLDFIAEVLASQGTVGELLAADWTIADSALAQAYGVGGTGRISLASTNRRGVINQGGFLSVFAHATESAPILRGVAILRRLLCYPVPSPTSLNIMIVPPLPDPNKTTRERFEIHAADPACAACHKSIDNVGFTFEGFDGMGMARPNGMENNQLVDTRTSLAIGVDIDGPFEHSGGLALALAASEDVRQCFARHMFRSAAARSDGESKAAEEEFLAAWAENPGAAGGHILETLRVYVASESFAFRRGR